MSEETIFEAALAKCDPAERAAYLDEACGGDAGLRQRVEALLGSHEKVGDYLERPALEQMAASPAVITAGDPHGPGKDPALGCLRPSARPDSLGRLGHYEVLEVLGRGGCGTVLRAFDEKLHRMVAIKVMAPHLAATSPPRKRFLREARSAAALRHENVVGIYDIEDQPTPYLVMEYVAGETLQQKLDRDGPIEVAEVLQIGRQIAEGLAAAHALGIIHRDIKPANILLENGALPRVKITDFGLARAVDDASLTQSGFLAGTPMYMAPEQARGEIIDQRADLFSLGSVLYVMCSGRPPFRAPTTLAVLKRVAEETPRSIREIIPDVPSWLCAIIAKLHAKEPADRFASAKEVADLLARHLAKLQLDRGQESPVGSGPVRPAAAEAEIARAANPRTEERSAAVTALRPARPRTAALLVLAAVVAFVGLAASLLVVLAVGLYFLQPVPSPHEPEPDAAVVQGLAHPAAPEDLIASAGFNDARGMNSKPGAGSPYPLDTPNREGGAGEPGWVGPWLAHPRATFQSKVVFEGDGALFLQGSPNVGPNYSRQFAKAQTGRFQVEYYLQVPGGSHFGAYVWQHPLGADWSGPTWNAGNGKFIAQNKDTGFKCVPGQWYKVTLRIDVEKETWEFFVDDKRFETPQALKFRGKVAYLDAINFLVEGGVYIDALRVTELPGGGKKKPE